MRPEDQAVVRRYRDHLSHFRSLQQVPGSNWTDAMVAKAMVPHRAEAERELYRAGFTRDQVAGLLAEPRPEPRPARTVSEHMNRLIREGRT
jgi:hypothetical protein